MWKSLACGFAEVMPSPKQCGSGPAFQVMQHNMTGNCNVFIKNRAKRPWLVQCTCISMIANVSAVHMVHLVSPKFWRDQYINCNNLDNTALTPPPPRTCPAPQATCAACASWRLPLTCICRQVHPPETPLTPPRMHPHPARDMSAATFPHQTAQVTAPPQKLCTHSTSSHLLAGPARAESLQAQQSVSCISPGPASQHQDASPPPEPPASSQTPSCAPGHCHSVQTHPALALQCCGALL